MNEVMKPPLDGFSGLFEDTVEGEDSATKRLIQGQKVKFSNQATWTIGEGEELPKTRELIAANVTRVTQKWDDGQPIGTRILEPGEKFPDVEKLNANTPQSEWREGPDGKLQGPWQNSYVVYLLDMSNAERFTYVASTIGGGIAVRDLVDRTRWMRSFRGANVYPIVTLSDTFMSTHFGGRQRPQFVIKRWVLSHIIVRCRSLNNQLAVFDFICLMQCRVSYMSAHPCPSGGISDRPSDSET